MRRATAIFLPLFATAVGVVKSAPCAAQDLTNDGAFDAAVAAAGEVVPQSTMIDARLLSRGDRNFYEILLMATDGALYAVYVDAENARVVRPSDVRPDRAGPDTRPPPRVNTRRPPPKPRQSPRPDRPPHERQR